MSFVGNFIERATGIGAIDDAKKASKQRIGSREDALDFTREATDPIRGIGLEALQSLAAGYGIGDGKSFYQQAADDPFTRFLIDQGLEGAATTGAATGELRGGNFQALSSRVAPSVIQNQAQQRAAGLQNLSGYSTTGVDSIRDQIIGLGDTRAEGTIGIGQARQDATNNLLNTLGSAWGDDSDKGGGLASVGGGGGGGGGSGLADFAKIFFGAP